MLGNIWVSSALIVIAIYSSFSIYESYSVVQEAKQMQENYEIISDIKSLIAKQYNRNTEDITREEIIMHLPNGGNWEKVLLLDRNLSSTTTENAMDTNPLMNKEGNIVLNENDRIRLLALRSKLNNILDTTTITSTDSEFEFNIGNLEKNSIQKDISINTNLKFAIEYLTNNILYSSTTLTSLQVKAVLVACITEYMPSDDIYQLLESGDTKEDYFRARIKEILLTQNSAIETRLYNHLKDLL